MACYHGLATTPNKVAWATFAVLFLIGVVMVPLGLAKFMPCLREYEDCLDVFWGIPADSPYNPCNPVYEECGLTWARVYIVGLVFLGLSAIPQCYFCCCAQNPAKTYAPLEVVMAVPVPAAGGYPLQPGMYPVAMYPQAVQPYSIPADGAPAVDCAPAQPGGVSYGVPAPYGMTQNGSTPQALS